MCVYVCVLVLVSSTRDTSLVGLTVGWGTNMQGSKSGNPLIAACNAVWTEDNSVSPSSPVAPRAGGLDLLPGQGT